jgi:hypothetical protein
MPGFTLLGAVWLDGGALLRERQRLVPVILITVVHRPQQRFAVANVLCMRAHRQTQNAK